MDVNKLLKALEDDTNENLFNFTTKKIQEMNLKVLQELNISKKEILDFLEKLKEYKYVDEMDDLKYGSYIRWVPLINPKSIDLKKGAFFCEIVITDNGILLKCKNAGYKPSYFTIKFDENLVFQKLTDEEQVLLSALNHLSK